MLGQDLVAALPELRANAESRMLSRVQVQRRAGTTTASNGLEVAAWSTVHADLPFRVSGGRGAAGSQIVTIGGVEAQVPVRVGHFPATTADLRDGDLVEVTAGENVGAVFRVVEAGWQDQATARRVALVGVQRPAEWPS